MGDIYMTNKAGARLVKLMITGMVLFLLLVGYVFYQSSTGRHNLAKAEKAARIALVDSQRSGCERGKLDRRANASGWRTAQAARIGSLSEILDIPPKEVEALIPQLPQPDDPPDLTAIRRYDKIAQELEERSEIDCVEAFPK